MSKKIIIAFIIIIVAVIITAVILAVVFKEQEVEDGAGQECVQPEVERPIRNGTMSLQTAEENITVGKTFQVDILMDTQTSNIVLASADIVYNNNILELVGVETQASVLNMSISEGKKVGEAEIIRGAPGDADYDDSDDGYAGTDGILASLKFKVLKIGSVEIKFNPDPEKSNMFLDDGLGTPMIIDYKNLILSIQ